MDPSFEPADRELISRQPSDRSGSQPNLLSVRDLRIIFDHDYGAVEVVRGVSFDIRRGASVALVGESGAGKSIIARAILGILPSAARVSNGEMLFSDPDRPGSAVDLAQLDPKGRDYLKIRGGRISMIFQEPMTSLSPFHTIGDQILEALLLHRNVSPAEGRELTVDILRLCNFPNPDQAPRCYSFELSGGLRQRAMIAMALVCHPALLIADEPTTALDVSIQAQILGLVKELQTELDMAVLMITHDLGVVANVADEVVVLFHGEVMESGTATDLFSTPRHPYLKGLFGAVPHFDMKRGERLVSLREIGPKKKPTGERALEPAATAPLLEVQGVAKSFVSHKEPFWGKGKSTIVKAVDDVSFVVGRRESVGLVGESGCGKTTLSKMILRALKPDRGRILFRTDDGRLDLASVAPVDLAVSRAIQMVFQDPFSSLNPRMTILDIIREPLVIHEIGDRDAHISQVRELMDLVGLDPRYLNRYPHSLSGGQRQRVALARALILDPILLILDEPTSALDVSIQAQILNLFNDLKNELGLSYFFISHNLAVVDYIADRILVMASGRIVEEAPREVLFSKPVHYYTKSLMAAVPYADLDRKLDFSNLHKDGLANPASWPEPFRIDLDRKMDFIDLGGGHRVLARAGADLSGFLS